jgi:hypothetical protein
MHASLKVVAAPLLVLNKVLRPHWCWLVMKLATR